MHRITSRNSCRTLCSQMAALLGPSSLCSGLGSRPEQGLGKPQPTMGLGTVPQCLPALPRHLPTHGRHCPSRAPTLGLPGNWAWSSWTGCVNSSWWASLRPPQFPGVMPTVCNTEITCPASPHEGCPAPLPQSAPTWRPPGHCAGVTPWTVPSRNGVPAPVSSWLCDVRSETTLLCFNFLCFTQRCSKARTCMRGETVDFRELTQNYTIRKIWRKIMFISEISLLLL